VFQPQNLRALKAYHGYSASELAKMVDVSEQTVSNWLTGRTTPWSRKHYKLAKVFGVRKEFFTETLTFV
jgi:transcriptional regulator with XRE-family HTH domain